MGTSVATRTARADTVGQDAAVAQAQTAQNSLTGAAPSHNAQATQGNPSAGIERQHGFVGIMSQTVTVEAFAPPPFAYSLIPVAPTS